MMLKQFLIRLESTSRWLLGGFALFLVVAIYLLTPAAEETGLAGSGPRAHEPATAYSSLTNGDLVVEYPYSTIQDCEKFRSEMLAKAMVVSECKLGRDLDLGK